MFNVGGGEIVVILLIALLVLGPDRLPEYTRKAARLAGELRRMSTGFQNEMREAMRVDEPTVGGAPAAPQGPRLLPPPATGPATDGEAAGGSEEPRRDPPASDSSAA